MSSASLTSQSIPSLPANSVPAGVRLVAGLHFVAGTLAILVAILLSLSKELPLPSALLLLAIGVLAWAAGLGLLRLMAWAWWLVILNAGFEATIALLSATLTPTSLITFAIVLPVALYLWTAPIRAAFARRLLATGEKPPGGGVGAGLAILSFALLVSFSLSFQAGESNEVEGRWILFDGIGVQLAVFDAQGRMTNPTSPTATGHGRIEGDRLTIEMEGLEGGTGPYSARFEGTRILEGDIPKDLPPLIAAADVEAAFFGSFERSDLADTRLSVVAIKLFSGADATRPKSPSPRPSEDTQTPQPTATPATSTSPPFPVEGHIAFERNGGVYLMNADGTGQTLITSPGSSPSLSADGLRIAFESSRDGNPEIYVINVDGSQLLRLTNHEAIDAAPSWAPDGQRIAFSSSRASASSIYTMNADGTGIAQLTHTPNPDYDPAWSPDGTRIAFTATRDGNFEIYLMNVNGTGQKRLTKDGDVVNPEGREPVVITSLGTDNQPAWSPDGGYVVFRRGGAPGDLFVVDADGTRMDPLTSGALDPSWSPDGTEIVFAYRGSLYVMTRDGSNKTQLTSGADPSWSR